MKKNRFLQGVLISLVLCSSASYASRLGASICSVLDNTTVEVSKKERIDVGFSPEGDAEQLVLKVIGSAKSTIRLAAYSFTSAPITQALLQAKKRGVDVAVIVDYKGNLRESGHASVHALNALAYSGIPVRTVSLYAIHHDKYIVVDGMHVETGSFNYTAAANRKNSENVLVVWNNAKLAQKYIDHWQSRWERGKPYFGAE